MLAAAAVHTTGFHHGGRVHSSSGGSERNERASPYGVAMVAEGQEAAT